MKNCVTDESSTSKINANVDNRIETGKFSLFDHKMLKILVISAFVANPGQDEDNIVEK